MVVFMNIVGIILTDDFEAPNFYLNDIFNIVNYFCNTTDQMQHF